MTDLEVKPYFLTLQQTAIIINMHVKTVRRYIEEGKLKGHNPNGNCPGAKGLRVTVESVKNYIKKFELEDFNDQVFEGKIEEVTNSRKRGIKTVSRQLVAEGSLKTGTKIDKDTL